jgi:NAD(P)-dependent dehydrogenase (short-subunit alcohol dehydrogenase family)
VRLHGVAVAGKNENACHDAVKAALDSFGHLDVLVNNAGYEDSRPFEETPTDDPDNEFEP